MARDSHILLPMDFEAIIFDMDGVLVDSEAYIAEAGVRMFKELHGIEVELEDFRPFIGAGENRFLGGVAEKYGVLFQQERDKAKTYEIYVDLVRGKLRELPGAASFVRECRTRGLRTALATSADKIKMVANLHEIGLDHGEFDAMVNGLDIERKKPFPDIFIEAARRINVDPRRCVVVEDSISGVQAAIASGARCLALLTTFPEEELRAAGATLVARDLSFASEALFGDS